MESFLAEESDESPGNATGPPPLELCGASEAHAPATAAALSALYGAVFLLGLVGNLLVLGIVYARPKLRSPSNVNLVNLALADLVGLAGLPFALAGQLRPGWTLGEVPCVLLGFVTLWSGTATVLVVLHISVYRYFVVARARGRAVKVLRRRTVGVNALLWPLAALLCSPPLLGWGRYRACPVCFLDLPSSRSFVVFHALATAALPSALMVFCYARICGTVRDSSKRVRGTAQALFRAASAVLAEGVSPAPEARRSRCSLREVEFLALPGRSPHHHHHNLHHHRASDPGILAPPPMPRPDKRLSVVSYTSVIGSMRPEELRLGRSLVLVSVAYLLFWLPAVGGMLAVAFLGERGPTTDNTSPSPRSLRGLWLAVQLCLYAHAAVNPFVYGLLTDPFRSALGSALAGRTRTRPGLRGAGPLGGEAKRPSLALDRLHAVDSDTYLDRSNSDSRACERINLKRLSVPEAGHHHRLSL